jgi:hypothetical protein
MKLKLFLVLAILIFSVVLSSCGEKADDTTELPDVTEPAVTEPAEETDPPETEPPHEHNYVKSKTVDGTCVEEGYEIYSCECGLSYKNIIPSAHKYTGVKDSTGKYTKNVCSLCGDYRIVRNQSYIFNVTFDGFNDVKAAINSQKALNFYAISAADGTKGKGEVRQDADGSFGYVYDANFYFQDKNKALLTKSKYVLSADIKFEKTTNMELLSIVFQTLNGSWNYNSGVVKVTADGKFMLAGEEKPLDIAVKTKGYNNLSVVFDTKTGLCDVYIDEQLVGKNIAYKVFPDDAKGCYIRYFDRKAGYAGCIDNIKMYVADTPEFVVPDGLVFSR